MNNSKFLDKEGLTHFMSKLKVLLNNKVTLGDDGKIISSQLPSYVDDVVEFSGIITDTIEIQQVGIEGAIGTILFSTSANCFVFAVQNDLSAEVKYYNIWETHTSYQDDTFVPYAGKIYVDISTNKTYRWSGSSLVEVSSGSLSLGETSATAYAGDKGAKNASDIAAIKEGDLPLVTPEIVPIGLVSYVWQIKDQEDNVISSTSSTWVDTIYGYLATFMGSLQWTHKDGYKDPTAIGDGAWAGKSLPASGAISEVVSYENVSTDKTITASIKAPKQGLILSNGIIKEASSTDYDVTSATANIHFQYKAVAAASTSELTETSLQALLASSANGGNYLLQNGKNRVITGVTTGTQEYYVYAYPATLGYLSRITMNDATPLLSEGFVLSQLTVTDPETKASVKYNVYTSVQRGAFTNAKLDIA